MPFLLVLWVGKANVLWLAVHNKRRALIATRAHRCPQPPHALARHALGHTPVAAAPAGSAFCCCRDQLGMRPGVATLLSVLARLRRTRGAVRSPANCWQQPTQSTPWTKHWPRVPCPRAARLLQDTGGNKRRCCRSAQRSSGSNVNTVQLPNDRQRHVSERVGAEARETRSGLPRLPSPRWLSRVGRRSALLCVALDCSGLVVVLSPDAVSSAVLHNQLLASLTTKKNHYRRDVECTSSHLFGSLVSRCLTRTATLLAVGFNKSHRQSRSGRSTFRFQDPSRREDPVSIGSNETTQGSTREPCHDEARRSQARYHCASHPP